MSFYDNIKTETVIPLLTEFGKNIELHKRTTIEISPGNVQTLWNLDTTGIGIQTEYSNMSIDGTLIKKQDKKIIVTNINQPDEGDKLKIDNVFWNIIDINELKPASSVVLYKIQVRQ